jgi:hypothetical protein
MRYDISKHNEARKLSLPGLEIEADYLAGLTVKEIAQKHGVSVQPVKRILRERGIPSRPAAPRKGILAGKKNPAWSGGRRTRTDGYVMLRTTAGEVLEHRYVMEQLLGRSLTASEVVHHKDGNRSNNDISNLEVHTSQRNHALLHGLKERERLLAGGQKQCTLCLLVKPLSEFYKTKFNAMGVQSWCKKCKNEKDSQRRNARSCLQEK